MPNPTAPPSPSHSPNLQSPTVPMEPTRNLKNRSMHYRPVCPSIPPDHQSSTGSSSVDISTAVLSWSRILHRGRIATKNRPSHTRPSPVWTRNCQVHVGGMGMRALIKGLSSLSHWHNRWRWNSHRRHSSKR